MYTCITTDHVFFSIDEDDTRPRKRCASLFPVIINCRCTYSTTLSYFLLLSATTKYFHTEFLVHWLFVWSSHSGLLFQDIQWLPIEASLCWVLDTPRHTEWVLLACLSLLSMMTYFLSCISSLMADQYVLLGAEEGLFSLMITNQGDPVMEQVSPRACQWMRVVENALIWLSSKEEAFL